MYVNVATQTSPPSMDPFHFHSCCRWIIRIVLGILITAIAIRLPRAYLTHAISRWGEDIKKEVNYLERVYHSRKKSDTSDEKRTDFFSLFMIPDNLDERTKTLKSIHDYIHSTLNKLQNEGDCEEKKIVRCSNTLLSGFGSTVHRQVICLHIAFALGRMFIIDQPQHAKFNGLAAFTQLESGKCGYLKKNLSSITDRCDFKDLNCYIDKDGYTIDNSYKLLEFTREADFPAPKFIPGTLPQGIAKALKKIGMKDPWHWFTSQMLGYMVMRPNEKFRMKFQEAVRLSRLQRPVVGLHFRGGDKISEARHVSEEMYIDKVSSIFTNKLKSAHPNNVFLATDDSRKLKKSRKYLNNSYFITTSPMGIKLRKIGQRDDSSKDVMEKILMDLYFLVHCDYLVLTFSSNIGRLIWELKTSQYPYDVKDRVVSMDYKMFYGWYDYDAHTTYYLTIRDNNNTVYYGNNVVMPYKKGALYFKKGTMKQSIKTFSANGKSDKVRHVRLRHSSNPVVEGYILEKDLITWPGMPFYKNDVYLSGLKL